MEIKKLIETLHLVENLKDATRHCYTSKGRHESVAEHTFRMTLMAYFIKDEFPEANIDKVIKMCLIHDLGESFTGDIPVFQKTKQDEQKEEELLNNWVASLPHPYNHEMAELYKEMSLRNTLESKIYKALDTLEALIQHNESDIKTWSPNEYELNMTNGDNLVTFSNYLTELRKYIKEETINKIKSENNKN